MTTFARKNEFYVETKRVVVGADGERVVKSVTCCCALSGAKPRDCSLVAGNKTPCRCDCHRSRS